MDTGFHTHDPGSAEETVYFLCIPIQECNFKLIILCGLCRVKGKVEVELTTWAARGGAI